MSTMHFNVHVPVGNYGDGMVALVVGEPEVEVGSLVSIRDYTTMAAFQDLYVRDTLVAPLAELPPHLLAAMHQDSAKEVAAALTSVYGIGFPANAKVTLLIIGDPDADLEGLYEEPVLGEDEEVLSTVVEEEDEEEYPWDDDEEDQEYSDLDEALDDDD